MEINDDNFEEKVIEQSKKKIVVVDFWASWCVPCNMLTPALEKVIGNFEDKVELVKINVDECPKTANKFAINAIPAVKFFKNSNLVGEFIGVQPEDSIRKMIEKVL